MIGRKTLETITPDRPPEVALEALSKKVQDVIVEDILLKRINLWCEAIRQNIRDNSELFEVIAMAEFGGIGIIDIAGDFSLGIALYGPSELSVEPFSIDVNGYSFPIVSYKSDLRYNSSFAYGHNMKGSFSAFVEDSDGLCIITARHNIEGLPLGARVNVQCPISSNLIVTRLEKRGHLYLDIACLRVIEIWCHPITPIEQTLPAIPGLTVHHHFPSSGAPVKATVKHPVGPPSTIILGSNPRTFTTSTVGEINDSGSAISTNQQGATYLVGSHSGRQTVIHQGVKTVQSFAQDIDEAIRLFDVRLIGGMCL